MSEDKISYDEYSTLANKALGWLCVNQKEYISRDVYGYEGREADWGTIEKVAIERYQDQDWGPDGLLSEAFECVVVDNSDYSFMPNYVISPNSGERYSIDTIIDMARRVSAFEVERGSSPAFVYVENPNPEPVSPETGSHTQILNLNAKPARQGFAQNTNYNCAPNSVQCIIYYLTGIMIDEQKLASVGGTTTSGTGHSGINTMISWFNRNYDPTLTIEWKSFNDYGFSGVSGLFEAPNTALFFHLLYRNKWGHYEVPRIINIDNSKIEVYNSLSGGYVETRSFSTQRSYINGISQPGLCIIRRTD